MWLHTAPVKISGRLIIAFGLEPHVRKIRLFAIFIAMSLMSPFFSRWPQNTLLWIFWSVLLIIIIVTTLAEQHIHNKNAEIEYNRLSMRASYVAAAASVLSRRLLNRERIEAFERNVRNCQESLLQQVVSSIATVMNQQNDALHASWMVFKEHEKQLHTVCRDRPIESRQVYRVIDVDQWPTGASAAITKRESWREDDTKENQELYPNELPYLSFISIPIFESSRCIGVINIDHEEAAAFPADGTREYQLIESTTKEFGYIISMMEIVLESERSNGSNQASRLN